MANCCSADSQRFLGTSGAGGLGSLEEVHGYQLGRVVQMDPPVSEEVPCNYQSSLSMEEVAYWLAVLMSQMTRTHCHHPNQGYVYNHP